VKVWLTDKVLSTGLIEEVEGNLCTGRTDLIQLNNTDVGDRMVIKPNWHASREEAAKDAIRKLDYAIRVQKQYVADAWKKLDNYLTFRSNF
jgi:hypothetical protein